MGGAQVHWFSILNSILVVAFLVAIVLVILLHTVRCDLAQYEDLGNKAAPHPNDIAGWKLVAGDAFREPSHPVLLCVMVGDGVRILGMGVVTILFATLGFMSPASRGAFVSGMLCFYLVLGLAIGYTAVRLWKMVRHDDSTGWKVVAWHASVLFPGIGFSIFTALNCVLWYNDSTGVMPFALFVVLILVWFFVSVPLSTTGGIGDDATAGEHVLRACLACPACARDRASMPCVPAGVGEARKGGSQGGHGTQERSLLTCTRWSGSTPWSRSAAVHARRREATGHGKERK